MNENFKFFGKLGFIGVFTLVKIYFLSVLSTIVVISTCVSINLASADYSGRTSSGPAHTNGTVGLLSLLSLIAEHPIQSIIYALLVLICFFLISNGIRYTIRKLSVILVHEKKEDILLPKLDQIIQQVNLKTPNSIQTFSDFLQAKVQIIQAIKSSNENRWLKKAATYGVKKVDQLDINFEKENFNLLEEIKNKAIQYLDQQQKPSKKWFFMGIGAQWVLVLIVYCLNK
jgi:hypothetical protein